MGAVCLRAALLLLLPLLLDVGFMAEADRAQGAHLRGRAHALIAGNDGTDAEAIVSICGTNGRERLSWNIKIVRFIISICTGLLNN